MISENEIILRLLLGTLLGGFIGLERQIHGRPAGLRTHILVCIGAVLIMLVSEYYHNLAVYDSSYIRIDPARIAAGAITGVGFLGAGVILKMGTFVQGLTTAASIWVVSAIGLAIGAGMYTAGVGTFVITLFTLMILRFLEKRLATQAFYTLRVTGRERLEYDTVKAALSQYAKRITHVDYKRDIEQGEVTYIIDFSLYEIEPLRPIFDGMSALEGVKRVELT